jgi:hypothetical protein
MALTPPELVRAHLNLDEETIARLPKRKPVVVASKPGKVELGSLPDWPAMTIGVLTTLGDVPYAIPVTSPIRAGDRRILLALNRNDASLARLREQPQVALAILAEGDEAFTARGRASVVEVPMSEANEFAAVMIDVEHLDDHRLRAELVDAGVSVRWTDPSAEQNLQTRVDELGELARSMVAAPGPPE